MPQPLGMRLAASPRYKETAEYETSLADSKKVENLALQVVSIDPDRDTPGLAQTRTVISVTLTLGAWTYMGSHIQICGSKRAPDCAAMTISEIDSDIHP
jgi:hypothetical protein